MASETAGLPGTMTDSWTDQIARRRAARAAGIGRDGETVKGYHPDRSDRAEPERVRAFVAAREASGLDRVDVGAKMRWGPLLIAAIEKLAYAPDEGEWRRLYAAIGQTESRTKGAER